MNLSLLREVDWNEFQRTYGAAYNFLLRRCLMREHRLLLRNHEANTPVENARLAELNLLFAENQKED